MIRGRVCGFLRSIACKGTIEYSDWEARNQMDLPVFICTLQINLYFWLNVWKRTWELITLGGIRQAAPQYGDSARNTLPVDPSDVTSISCASHCFHVLFGIVGKCCVEVPLFIFMSLLVNTSFTFSPYWASYSWSVVCVKEIRRKSVSSTVSVLQ